MKKDYYPLFISRYLPQEANARKDLIERLSTYGKFINEYSQGECRGLKVLTSSSPISQQKGTKGISFIKFIAAPPSLIRYILFLKHYININEKTISVLVSSDPWVNLAIIKIANLPKDLKVQVSLHGEPYLRVNYLGNYRNLIKHLWLKIILKRIDSIRVVSQNQISEISRAYSVHPSKIFVAPIPVKVPNKIEFRNDSKTIVFLGRMHPERGIKMWVEMVLKLYEIRQDFDLLIIGDGVDRDFFQKSLDNSGVNIKYMFAGWVEQKFIAKYLKKAKVLLNTAQTESFGLAMREAQINGIPIVSLRTTGATANFKLFNRGIFIFDELESGLRYLSDCLDNSTAIIDIKKVRKSQELQNDESLVAIAKSWIK